MTDQGNKDNNPQTPGQNQPQPNQEPENGTAQPENQ